MIDNHSFLVRHYRPWSLTQCLPILLSSRPLFSIYLIPNCLISFLTSSNNLDLVVLPVFFHLVCLWKFSWLLSLHPFFQHISVTSIYCFWCKPLYLNCCIVIFISSLFVMSIFLYSIVITFLFIIDSTVQMGTTEGQFKARDQSQKEMERMEKNCLKLP